MPHLEMSEDDALLLREVIEAALLDLRREISHTDARDFRRTLIERQLALERLLRDLAREQALQ